jgi:hypothetical protein
VVSTALGRVKSTASVCDGCGPSWGRPSGGLGDGPFGVACLLVYALAWWRWSALLAAGGLDVAAAKAIASGRRGSGGRRAGGTCQAWYLPRPTRDEVGAIAAPLALLAGELIAGPEHVRSGSESSKINSDTAAFGIAARRVQYWAARRRRVGAHNR